MGIDVKTLARMKTILFINDRYGLLPEIADFFGDDQLEVMIDFLTTFGGMDIKVPPRDALNRAKRDAEIWEAMDRRPNITTVRFLAGEYEMDERSIIRAYRTTCRCLQEEMKYEPS